jgi:DNA repair protein RecO (recombination protein O)
MTVYQTEGIVLKKEDVGEADRRFLIFTRDYGKIEAMAKGVRKIKAKLAGHLEDFNRCHLMISISKGLRCNLISALALENFPGIKKDEEKIKIALRIAELFSRFLPFHHKEPDFWEILSSAFGRLEEADGAAGEVFFAFKIEFLKLLGYWPAPDFPVAEASQRDKFLDDYLKELSQV